MNDIKKPAADYLKLSTDISNINKVLKEKKKELKTLEEQIFMYMEDNKLNSLSFPEGQIIVTDKKVSQRYKKENIISQITEELQNEEMASKITESILNNDAHISHQVIKCKLNKQ